MTMNMILRRLLLFVIVQLNLSLVYCQELSLFKQKEIRVESFSKELQSFIKTSNTSGPKLCQYYVYVVYVYPLNNQEPCIGYTASFIFNSSSLNRIDPQYYCYIDSVNLVVVTFNSRIKERNIPGLKLIRLINNDIVYNKLLSEEIGFITGTTEAFIYNDCPKKKERINYDNLDIVPWEKSIFNSIPDGFEIKLIKKGMQDSIGKDLAK